MSNFGGEEMLVVLLLALIVLGPERLPKLARQAGAVMRQLRQMSSAFQEELRSAIEDPKPPRPDTTPAIEDTPAPEFSGRLTAVPNEPDEAEPALLDEVKVVNALDPAFDEDDFEDEDDSGPVEGVLDTAVLADADEPPADGTRAAG